MDAFPGTQVSSHPHARVTALGVWRGRPLAGRKLDLADRACSGGPLSPTFSYPLIQFVCVESLVTALVDMYPRVFRKKNRREILILIVSVISFFIGLIMLTEVRVWEARWGLG